MSVQSNLRSCANTRATRNTYGFNVTRIENKKAVFFFVQKLESYLLTVAKSAIFCACSVRVIMYTRACTHVRVYPSRARLGHGLGMHTRIRMGPGHHRAAGAGRSCALRCSPSKYSMSCLMHLCIIISHSAEGLHYSASAF